jgi:predicted acyl esterase
MIASKSRLRTSRRAFLAGAALTGTVIATTRVARAQQATQQQGSAGASGVTVKEFTVGQTKAANLYGHARDFAIVLERDLRVQVRDGIALAANVFRPKTAGKYPALVYFAPKIKDRFPAYDDYERIPNTGAIRVSEYAAFEAPDPVYWVPHGYALVAVNCRASGDSEGEYFAHFADQMATDFYDVIEWVARQEWCDGNVGTNGVSYLATTQWMVAAKNPPHLKAIMPWEGLNDPYREWAFNGGIPDTGFFKLYMSRTLTPGTGFVRAGASYEDILAERAKRPTNDAFWKSKHPDLTKISVPAYVCASWSTQGLHNRGALEGYKQIASRQKWLEVHGRKEWETYYSRECLERQRRFFDHFLKGIESGIAELPRVRFEVRERFYEWRTRFADDFPIPGTDFRRLYLSPGERTLAVEPVPSAGTIRYSAGKTSSQPDRAEFVFTFRQRTELVGNMKLKLWVSTEGADDMDLEVGIKKFDRHAREVFFPDFNHMENGMVASGWLRVSHRELDEARSTPQQPWHKHERIAKLATGEIVPVEVEILASGTAFDAGEQLRLIVQGYEILNFAYRNHHEETVNQGRHVLHAGGPYDSHLLVPAIPTG